MRHPNYDRPGCPVEACAEIMGGKWKGPILFYLLEGTRRFNELRRLLPDTTQRTLTKQLRELEEDGIINRIVFPEVPPRVEYSLSALGQSLRPIIVTMNDWGAGYLKRRSNIENAKTKRNDELAAKLGA